MYSLQLEEGWLDDERNEFLEELNLEMLEEQHNEAMHYTANEVEQVGLLLNIIRSFAGYTFLLINN